MSWTKLNSKTFKVDYEDRMMPSDRHYGHPGRLTVSGDDVRYEPEARQLAGILVFSALFLPAFSITAYCFIPAPQKWFFVVAGPLIGSLTFGIIYFLIKREIDAGPYLEFIAASDEVVLPRIGKRFDKTDVTLQWITGRSKQDADVHSDLNLIADDGGNKTRYFVMGGPYRKYVKRFSEISGVPVVEVNVGWRAMRDLDRVTGT